MDRLEVIQNKIHSYQQQLQTIDDFSQIEEIFSICEKLKEEQNIIERNLECQKSPLKSCSEIQSKLQVSQGIKFQQNDSQETQIFPGYPFGQQNKQLNLNDDDNNIQHTNSSKHNNPYQLSSEKVQFSQSNSKEKSNQHQQNSEINLNQSTNYKQKIEDLERQKDFLSTSINQQFIQYFEIDISEEDKKQLFESIQSSQIRFDQLKQQLHELKLSSSIFSPINGKRKYSQFDYPEIGDNDNCAEKEGYIKQCNKVSPNSCQKKDMMYTPPQKDKNALLFNQVISTQEKNMISSKQDNNQNGLLPIFSNMDQLILNCNQSAQKIDGSKSQSEEKPQPELQVQIDGHNLNSNQASESNQTILRRQSCKEPIIINYNKENLKNLCFIEDYKQSCNISYLRYDLDQNLDIKSKVFLFNKDLIKMKKEKGIYVHTYIADQFRQQEPFFKQGSCLTETEQKFLQQYSIISKQYITLRGMKISGIEKDFKSEGIEKRYDLLAENENEILIIDWKFTDSDAFYLILVDYEEHFLEQIRVLQQIYPQKMVKICILPLKLIEQIHFIEFNYQDILDLQKNQANDYKFQKSMIKAFFRDLKWKPQIRNEYFLNEKGNLLTIQQVVDQIVENNDMEKIDYFSNVLNTEKLLFKRDNKKSYEQIIDKRQFKQFYYVHLLLCLKLNNNVTTNLSDEIVERMSKTMYDTEQEYNYKNKNLPQNIPLNSPNNLFQNSQPHILQNNLPNQVQNSPLNGLQFLYDQIQNSQNINNNQNSQNNSIDNQNPIQGQYNINPYQNYNNNPQQGYNNNNPQQGYNNNLQQGYNNNNNPQQGYNNNPYKNYNNNPYQFYNSNPYNNYNNNPYQNFNNPSPYKNYYNNNPYKNTNNYNPYKNYQNNNPFNSYNNNPYKKFHKDDY